MPLLSQHAVHHMDSSSDSESELDLSNSRGSTTTTSTKEEEEMKIELAKRETVIVTRLRYLVFFILLLAAITVSLIVYHITSSAEEQEADDQYEGAAGKVMDDFVDGVKAKLGGAASLAVAAIAHGLDNRQRWPFVTLSSFQQRATSVRYHSGAILIHFNPIVHETDKTSWEMYVSNETARSWIDEAKEYEDAIGFYNFLTDEERESFIETEVEFEVVGNDGDDNQQERHGSLPVWYYRSTSSGERAIDNGPDPYFPKWQSSPIFRGGSEINENVVKSNATFAVMKSYQAASVVIGNFYKSPPGGIDSEYYRAAFFSLMISAKRGKKVHYEGDPISQIVFPVFESFAIDASVVATISFWVHWGDYFDHILPQGMQGLILVLRDSCGGEYTYRLDGPDVINIGSGDHHDTKYDGSKWSASFASIESVADGTPGGIPLDQSQCQIILDVYPSAAFYDAYKTSTPLMVTCGVAIVFIFTSFMFLCYDRLVERRQAIVLLRAEQTTRIVTSLFPQQVADRLIQAANKEEAKDTVGNSFAAPNRRLKSFLAEDGDHGNQSQPIADLFPNCTVLFADIAGFTAWSSTRDPVQVFILLQTIYQAFDAIAKRRKVFKVETIGDSYVAVTGLPDPQESHAVIMARFAGECLSKMNQLTAELESSLGPDTADLCMRFGINSGPVTAGVLQGDRARFQLFGDTVNTAARMESTGTRNKIQVSKTTYDLLVQAGKAHWLRPRTETVEAKGKGVVYTYWLSPSARKASSASASSASDGISDRTHSNENQQSDEKPVILAKKNSDVDLKRDRLIDWVSDILKEHIKTIVALRKRSDRKAAAPVYKPHPTMSTPLDEVAEVIRLPRYNAKTFATSRDKDTVEIGEEVFQQLHQYVSIVASAYRDNHFHNFEHACHVTMAVNKFIKRIVSPDIDGAEDDTNMVDIASKLHEYTHGITSDPLTVFAIVFSALIHDADHRGVSNVQLAKEQKEMATLYRNKSVAEQNSVDIAWELLMAKQFGTLRDCLFISQDELDRFRQVVVNVVLATDIFDKEMSELRSRRWIKAFAETDVSLQQSQQQPTSSSSSNNNNNSINKDWNDLRATIVIEHIIQASDVAHTMQHWHVYRKWNKRLLMEMCAAHKSGRMATDPTEFWYEGELGFFDSYVLPLAKKLKDCNVFGVSSDECLNYATQNRGEWADRGRALVQEMKGELQALYDGAADN